MEERFNFINRGRYMRYPLDIIAQLSDVFRGVECAIGDEINILGNLYGSPELLN